MFLSQQLKQEQKNKNNFLKNKKENRKYKVMDQREYIAIIGMSGRFPGADNLEKFWENLRLGINSIKNFSEEELIKMGVPKESIKNPKYVKCGGFIEQADMFDASFFGFNPKEAEITDPQQRIFLECAYEALENAGYDPDCFDGLIGVFAGCSPNLYINLMPYDLSPETVIEAFQREIGNEKDYLATRVAYKLNLRGPCLTVQTACSTSLVAVHLACRSLLSYECDIALAGGSSVNFRQNPGFFYQDGMILSPDGICRAFDKDANGTVLGQGAGVIALKRLSEAIADGDFIYAVIIGSAINNDGSSKVGFTAPSIKGQAEVITMALANAEISADTIGYIETHGTGTPLGDPIEIAALTKAFRAFTDKKNFCAIGSVKTNIGHLDAAAGVAGLIKTALILKHKEIPPSLNFENPNPEMDLANSPFFVNTKLKKWISEGAPRRAGVSSFGIGGTNAHIILEEGPKIEISKKSRPRQLLLFSAKTTSALDKTCKNYLEFLKRNRHLNLADIAYTLKVGRKNFGHRCMLVCETIDDAMEKIEKENLKELRREIIPDTKKSIVFMFTGQGSQYVKMGMEIYKNEEIFKNEVDKCCSYLEFILNLDLKKIIFGEEETENLKKKIDHTSIAQPALFVIEYSLAKLFESWGIFPVALVGHSIGEYVAACLSGVFSLKDALSIVAKRGQLMGSLSPGVMIAVFLAEEEVKNYLNEKISLAVINGPSLCVLSGEVNEIAELEKIFKEKKISHRRLNTSHAFHSKMTEPILDEFREAFRDITLNNPKVPFLSNYTGTWVKEEDVVKPEYWVKHLRYSVRFSDCLEELFKEPKKILIEIGPGQTLTNLARQHPRWREDYLILPSMRNFKENKSDYDYIMNMLGCLWVNGYAINWKNFYNGERRLRVPLPTYPFEKKRYWHEEKRKFQYDIEIKKHEETKKKEGIEIKEEKKIEKIENKNNDEYQSAGKEKIISILQNMWEKLLGVPNIKPDDNFFELGGHSLIAIRLFAQIENIFGKRLPLATLFQAPTIAQLASIIAEKNNQINWDPLVIIQPKGNRIPFFCIHSEGGNVLEYQKFSEYLGEEQPFYALQAKGLEGEVEEKLSVEEMASIYIKEMKKIQQNGAYYIGGYCLGGLVAFEMARQLEMSEEKVGKLIMISTSTPDHLRTFLPNINIFKILFYKFIERLELEISNLSCLSWRKKISYLKDRINRIRLYINLKLEHYKGKIYNKILRKKFIYSRPYILERVRAHQNEAYLKYKPKPINIPILLFKTTKKPRYLVQDPTLGWEKFTREGVQVIHIQAFHKNILKDPQVKKLADAFKKVVHFPKAY